MAKTFAIVCDSSSDLSAAWCRENDVRVVPMKLHLPKGVYSDVVEVSAEQARELLLRGAAMGVSQPSVADFQNAFAQLAAEGFTECACVCTSQIVSITQTNARVAAEAVAKALPIAIEVIDSRTMSAGEGIVICDLVRNRAKGTSYAESIDHAKRLVESLTTLIVLPPGQAPRFLPKRTLASRVNGFLGRALRIWGLEAFDAKGAPEVVARSTDPLQLAGLASSLTAVDAERQGRMAFAAFSTGADEMTAEILKTATGMLPKNHDLGTVMTSGAVTVRMGLGAVGIAYAPEDRCVTDPDLPLFRTLTGTAA